MKLKLSIFISICLINLFISLNDVSANDFKGQTLTIYNVEDYISQGNDGYVDLIGNFEKQYGVKVNYYTYDTNETMYNQFTLQKEGTYDLICTSDYMIQKLIKEELVIKMDDYKTNIPNYDKYASSILRSKLKEMEVTYKDETVNLDEFAVGYMWGTLGIVYDPTYTSTIKEDVKSWDVFWDSNYKDVISIKNSIRDAYVVGLMHSYSKTDLFKDAMNNYLNNPTIENKTIYKNMIQEIFDFKLDSSVESDVENLNKIENVKNELISLKDNIFGFEVDSGKNDIITGKIKLNLAYSGDAVYSISTALEEQNKKLEYYVPEDGSNIWYDAWTIPKGANEKLAYEFLNYLSDPKNAVSNMEYIGYTSYIVGDEVFNLAGELYGATYYSSKENYKVNAHVIYNDTLYKCIKDKDNTNIIFPTNKEYFVSLEYNSNNKYYIGDMVSLNGKIYNCINNTNENPLNSGWEEVNAYDLTYLFSESLKDNRKAIIYPFYGKLNQLETQYPDELIVSRCAIMNDFDRYNENVVIMWGQVKAYTNMLPIYIFLSAILLLGITFIIISSVRKNISMKYKKRINNKKE